MKRYLKLAAMAIALVALLSVGATFGASYYYTSQYGKGCASCHEMANYVSVVHGSPHRTTNCMDCHEAGLGTKLRHVRVHLLGPVPESLHLRDKDVFAMVPNCQKCHQREYATWHAGPHSATYSQIFTDTTHNTKRALVNDCFRCHGAHFNGSIRDVVTPQDTKGPWKIIPAGIADQPTMPCQACHNVHRNGQQESKPTSRISVAGSAIPDSLAFYDRRESTHFTAASLSIPQLHDGARAVRMNQDPRQMICYQCHAPREPEAGTAAASNHWGGQVGSGDDRTPMGVHEGLSCISCHTGHNENARASCKTCHPQLSNCGLDVEKMDTTFTNGSSAHNIHWVKCADCHQHGVPKVKKPQPLQQGS
jgi:hypothetical protein